MSEFDFESIKNQGAREISDWMEEDIEIITDQLTI